MSSVTIYVPRDAAALSLGAEAVAQRHRRRSHALVGSTSSIVRNGSRGMIWLEPLVEVVTPGGRVALRSGARRRTCEACSTPAFSKGASIRCTSGSTEEIPVSQESAAADVRARRRHRSASASRTTSRTAATRACGARSTMAPARDRAGGHRLGAARPRRGGVSRPASSGRPCSSSRRRRSTSPATPTKATPARSPTAC